MRQRATDETLVLVRECIAANREQARDLDSPTLKKIFSDRAKALESLLADYEEMMAERKAIGVNHERE